VARYDTFMSNSFDEASKSARELAELIEETVDENSEGRSIGEITAALLQVVAFEIGRYPLSADRRWCAAVVSSFWKVSNKISRTTLGFTAGQESAVERRIIDVRPPRSESPARPGVFNKHGGTRLKWITRHGQRRAGLDSRPRGRTKHTSF
jgi:hypothetical protein